MLGRYHDRQSPSANKSTLPLGADHRALALLVVGAGVELEVALHGHASWTLGRAPDNDIVLHHPSVSRHHACLHVRNGFALEALAATNPLRVGGRQLGPGDRVVVAPGEAFALGALVGVIRPLSPGASAVTATGARSSARRAGGPEPGPLAVVADPAMIHLYEVVARIARSAVPVLILGETGAGKELVAHAVHRGSPRAAGPFVRINCGALPATLVESELFGHERGAFTGADRAKLGLLASASGGSVFLDEIGELPHALQATLLRVLEESAVRPVGATRPTPLDVRWIAATNRDLAAHVERGSFRKDLYYRLQGFVVSVPPLRERRGEIRAIARALLDASPTGPHVLGDHLLDTLDRHDWPGNVRELRNALASAALLAGPGPIDVCHLPPTVSRHACPAAPTATSCVPAAPAAVDRTLREALVAEERRRIIDALRQSDGNQSRAAELLGMPRRTLVKRLRDYNIRRGRALPDD